MQKSVQFVKVKDELGEARAEADELRRLLASAEERVRELESYSPRESWYEWFIRIILLS